MDPGFFFSQLQLTPRAVSFVSVVLQAIECAVVGIALLSQLYLAYGASETGWMKKKNSDLHQVLI